MTEDIENLKVWTAEPKDLDDVMTLALAACEENGFIRPDPLKLLHEIYPALHRHHGIIGLVGIPGKPPHGAILLRIGEVWYSSERLIEEKAIFIHPDYRSAKGGRARRLCEFGKKVSDELGLPLSIGVLSNDRTAGKIRMYRRIFGEPAGAYFLYNARTGGWVDNEHTQPPQEPLHVETAET
jgi:hypothetical protein